MQYERVGGRKDDSNDDFADEVKPTDQDAEEVDDFPGSQQEAKEFHNASATFQDTSLLANDDMLDKILSKKTKDSIIQSQIDHEFIQKQFYESPNQ